MPQFIAERSPADLLDIFGPNSPVPIPLPVLNAQLNRLLLALPGYAAASPEQQQEMRVLAMHELAAFMPGDVLEAQIAARLVALNAEAMDYLRQANEPGTEPERALHCSRHATTLMRRLDEMQHNLERRQTARRKAEEVPTERAGYWFKDVSVPPPPTPPATGDAGPPSAAENERQDPMHLAPELGAPPRPAAAEPSVSVTVADVMARMTAKTWGADRTNEQIWDECVQEAMAVARRERPRAA